MTSGKNWTLANIIKRYFLNIFNMSQQFYLITKQKLDENEITLKRENKIQSSITSKSNTEGEIKKKSI